MASSSHGAYCKKLSKRVFGTLSYIQYGAFAKNVNGFKYFCKKLVLDVLLVSKYASALYPQKYAKIQLLNNFSEILNKFFSFLF